jgi:hypothetical protein
MAENTNTMAGILALNDRNLSPEEASAILNRAPVLAQLFAQRASPGGTTHKFQRKLTAPGVGFRLVNEGITNATGTFEVVTQTLALLDATVRRDKGVVLAFDGGYMDRESTESLAEALFKMECAIFRANINKQFTGLPGSEYFDQITVDSQVVNAGGSGGKSVWMLRSAANGISAILGQDGKINVGEDTEVQATDSSSRAYSAIQRSILGWCGLQVGCQYDAARIVNLDGTSGKTLTDSLLMQAWVKGKVGAGFNMIAMSRTSLYELWASRTAVNPTGAEANVPTSWQGIPIIVTDAIPENEATINMTTTTTTTSTQA